MGSRLVHSLALTWFCCCFWGGGVVDTLFTFSLFLVFRPFFTFDISVFLVFCSVLYCCFAALCAQGSSGGGVYCFCSALT